MIGFCVLFAFGVAYIAYRGVTGTTGVNIAINIIQITALLIFSVIALGYRLNHGEGSVGLHARPGRQCRFKSSWPTGPTASRIKDEKTGQVEGRARERATRKPLRAELQGQRHHPGARRQHQAGRRASKPPSNSTKRPFRWSAPHSFNYVIIQACIAILILVGFESVTSMGEEAKNAKRDIPRAVLLSLFIQGVVCYLIEYFCAELLPEPRLHVTTAAGSSAPIGDMMVIVGHLAVRQPGGRLVVHVHPGDHGVPGPGRHDAVLHLHRCPGHLRHGPRRRGPLALRHVARQEPDAAPGHLDAGRRFRRWSASSPSCCICAVRPPPMP